MPVSVGRSPLVQVEGVYAKLECTNPCGSIKDRIGRYILEESERRGLLQPGTRIIEATSGNTGIAFAYFARLMGYPITVVMPCNMTDERKSILQELGADLVLCSEEGSFAEAAEIRDRLAAEHGWFNPDQFSNPLNTECHERTTGREIVDQIRARGLTRVDAFVAGVGTGGTLIGVGRRLLAEWPDVELVAVEPAESAIMSGGRARAPPHSGQRRRLHSRHRQRRPRRPAPVDHRRDRRARRRRPGRVAEALVGTRLLCRRLRGRQPAGRARAAPAPGDRGHGLPRQLRQVPVHRSQTLRPGRVRLRARAAGRKRRGTEGSCNSPFAFSGVVQIMDTRRRQTT